MHCVHRHTLIKVKQCRFINTWSNLASVFNRRICDSESNNPNKKQTGLFSVPILTNPEGFLIQKNEAYRRTRELITEATSRNRKRKMVQIFDELSNTLCEVADLVEFIRIGHPDKHYIASARETGAFISDLVEQLNTHKELYDSLRNISLNGDVVETSKLEDHVMRLFLFDFEQSGIHLPETQRKQVTQLNSKILQIGQEFMAGTSPRIIDSKIIPSHLKNHFYVKDGYAIIEGCYYYSSDAAARETMYKLYLSPDDQQECFLQELLNSRQELAELCGFPSYAHRAVKGSTLESPALVHEFLNILNKELKSKADTEYCIMQEMKNMESSSKQKLMPWDINYFRAKAKSQWLDISISQISPYLSLGDCMNGINMLTHALYDIQLIPEETLPGEVWTNDITKLAVVHANEGLLGYIYCDFYYREGKAHQDCHFSIRGGRRLPDGSYQNPIAVLMLSLPQPKRGQPCLLSLDHLENLFHEMGHALHSMLGRTEYQHVCGTRCSTDFAEVPSILMEYFASDPRVVSKFARHYQTQEPIPQTLLDKLSVAESIFGASATQTQVFYSMLDQVYHSQRLTQPSTNILKEIHNDYYGVPYVENTAWQLRFSHLVGYGAKYYSYLVSRAIASWIWQTYFEADPFSRSAGERYRREVLEHGGGKPPSELVSDFLNKEANANNLAKSLLNELDKKSEFVQQIKR